jgi:hypothetical protein
MANLRVGATESDTRRELDEAVDAQVWCPRPHDPVQHVAFDQFLREVRPVEGMAQKTLKTR